MMATEPLSPFSSKTSSPGGSTAADPAPLDPDSPFTASRIYSPAGGGWREVLVHVPEGLKASQTAAAGNSNSGSSTSSGNAAAGPSFPARSWPLIVALHDKGQSAEVFAAETELTDPAVNSRYLVIFPRGLSQQWTGDPAAPSRSEVNDLMFLDDVMKWALSRYPVDSQRIFLAGCSTGAGLAALVACHPRLSHAVCAIGLASASIFQDESFGHPLFSRFDATRFPLPLLEFHGDADPIVDYNGTDTIDGPSWPMGAWIKAFTRMNERGLNDGQSLGQVADEEDELYDGKVERYVWRCGTDMDVVVHYMIHGFGHGWPSTKVADNEEVRRGPAEIDATPIMLAFFDEAARYERHDFTMPNDG